MTDKSILIFGASRGIGLGLARELAGRGWHVHATERETSGALHELAAASGITIHTADVTEPASYADLAIADGSLDAVLVNAGIIGAAHQDAAQATMDEVSEVMMTNTFGPIRAGKRLMPLLRDGGTLAFMSSLLGSVADSSGGYDLYRASKAAQNILAKGVAQQEAKARGVQILSLHPGWVQTDMGGPQAPLSVQESAAGLADVIEVAGGGGYRYCDYTGKDLPF